MVSATAIVLSFWCLAAGTLAHPVLDARANVQTAHLTFNGGPASYSLAVVANGTVFPTNNSLIISVIDDPDYDAISQCMFITDGNVTLSSAFDPTTGAQQIIVGPPQPIIAVSCLGQCVSTFGTCFDQGMPLGPCCAGFCAANRCRPFVSPF